MNVVIMGSTWTTDDLEIVFGDESVELIDADDLALLCVGTGAYPSTSKARQAGRKGPIPTGFTKFKASKKQTLWIWNPTE